MKPPQTQQQPPQTSHPETLHLSKVHHLPSTSHPLDHYSFTCTSTATNSSSSSSSPSSSSCPSVTLMNFALDNSHTQAPSCRDKNIQVKSTLEVIEHHHLNNGIGDLEPIHHLMHPLQVRESPSPRAPPPMTHPSTPHHQPRPSSFTTTPATPSNNGHLDHSTSHTSILYSTGQESRCESSSAALSSASTCKVTESISDSLAAPSSSLSPCNSPNQITMSSNDSSESASTTTARAEEMNIKNHSSLEPSSDSIKEEKVDPTGLNINSNSNACVKSQSSCFGCGSCINDRYYLLALDQKWHTCCLKCCICKVSLDSEVSCFTRESRIYCKEDYYK